jgi:hypothetical protein
VITKIDNDSASSDLKMFGCDWEFNGDIPTRKEDGAWVFDSF